jgi:hypothetical protein
MANWQHSAWAALIGGAGSLAYFSALFFGFIQGEEILAKLWPTIKTLRWHFKVLRIFWFMLIGGAVAFIFQLPQGDLAPIQAFIVGTTWPTIVAQILTSRQAESPQAIKDQIASLLGK